MNTAAKPAAATETKSAAAQVEEIYLRSVRRRLLFIGGAAVALAGVVVFAIITGTANISPVDSLMAVFNPDGVSEFAAMVVRTLRGPRIVMALIAGAAFAISGTTMQGVLRNPLVSPYILGLSHAAAFGAGLAIVYGVGFVAGEYLIVINAFVFGLAAMFLVYGISSFRGVTPETVILAGVAVGYLFSAAVAALKYFAPTHEQLREIVFWLMGGLITITWEKVFIVLPVVVCCLGVMAWLAWDLNIMTAGDEVATSLGVNTRRVTIISLVVATLATTTVIAFTGVIGFIALVAPHITRMMVGTDHRYLLPASCLVGALLLLLADTAARTVLSPSELPVGILTAAIGVPFFLYLLMRRRKTIWQ